jgi:hypothetical protein
MILKRYTLQLCLAATAAFVLCSSAQATSIPFAERLLPTTGINDTNASNYAIPSNYTYSWDAGTDTNDNAYPAGSANLLVGDNFFTGDSYYRLDAFSVWGVSSGPLFNSPLPVSLTLLLGTGGIVAPISTNFIVGPATYSDVNNPDYVSTHDGLPHQLWQITFTPDSTVLLAPNTTYEFAVDGGFLIHACLQGSCSASKTVTDGQIMNLFPNGDGTYGDYFASGVNNGTPTDSPVDLNFQASGEAVPEPSTWMLLGAGLSALVLARRRR